MRNAVLWSSIRFTVGILVFGLAQLEYVALQRWEEVAEILLGLWLIRLALHLGYSGDGLLRFWHSSLGGLVCCWRRYSSGRTGAQRQDLAKHGQ